MGRVIVDGDFLVFGFEDVIVFFVLKVVNF